MTFPLMRRLMGLRRLGAPASALPCGRLISLSSANRPRRRCGCFHAVAPGGSKARRVLRPTPARAGTISIGYQLAWLLLSAGPVAAAALLAFSCGGLAGLTGSAAASGLLTSPGAGGGGGPHLALLMAGVAFSRYGLLLFDMTVQQLLQEEAAAGELGAVTGAHNALCSALATAMFAAGLALRRPEAFGGLVLMSLTAVRVVSCRRVGDAATHSAVLLRGAVTRDSRPRRCASRLRSSGSGPPPLVPWRRSAGFRPRPLPRQSRPAQYSWPKAETLLSCRARPTAAPPLQRRRRLRPPVRRRTAAKLLLLLLLQGAAGAAAGRSCHHLPAWLLQQASSAAAAAAAPREAFSPLMSLGGEASSRGRCGGQTPGQRSIALEPASAAAAARSRQPLLSGILRMSGAHQLHPPHEAAARLQSPRRLGDWRHPQRRGRAATYA